MPNSVHEVVRVRRNWLLAGTAIVGGSFLGAMGTPTAALAACAATVAGQEWACSGAGAAFSDTITAEPWGFLIAGTIDPLTPYTGTGTITLNNNGDFSGQLDMNDGATLTVPGHGIVLNNNAPNDSIVTFNIGGDITTTGTGNRDAIRLQGATLNVNILDTSQISAADDGIVVTVASVAANFNIAQGATVSGTANSGSNANGGDGILVATNGAPGNQVAGSVTIDNYGHVNGASGGNTSPTATGGAALNISAAGAINITNYADGDDGDALAGTLTGTSGIYADGGAAINITNFGHIESTQTSGAGIFFRSGVGVGGPATTIRNNSTSSIVGAGDGITGGSAGADVLVFNGDGGVDNPDGLIDVGGIGINIESTDGGNIFIFNGMTSNTASSIIADGAYGIYARSRANGGGGESDGVVEAFNLGLVEVETSNADAVVYVRSSADLDGYAAATNGIAFPEAGGEIINRNARLNGYDFDGDNSPNIFDANGIELVKYGGAGGLEIDDDDDFDGFYGVAAANEGAWDFARDDNYLTPGYNAGGAVGSQYGTSGGIFAPGGSAVLIRHFGTDDSGFFNSGTTIGQGSNGDPVLDIQTYDNGDNRVVIYNGGYDYDSGTFGLIGSENTPYAWDFDIEQAFDTGLGYYSGGGVDWDFILNDIIGSGELARFADAGNDRLAYASGASVWGVNEGILIGQVNLPTSSANTIDNYGVWLSVGSQDGNSATNSNFSDYGDVLNNWGLVQVALDNNAFEGTNFYNLGTLNNYGVLSLLDGNSGDYFYTDASYYGGGGSALLALDVYLGTEDDPGTEDQDIFGFDDGGATIEGSTGVLINNTNDGPGGINLRGIDIVNYDDESGIYNPCGGPNDLCQEGDAFFISDLNQNYINIGGYGALQNGFYATFLRQDTDYNDFELITDFAPNAAQLPGLVTAAQNIWYTTDSLVEDHMRGNRFAGAGGGGADAVVEVEEAVVDTTNYGLWAKVGGSWTDRDTTVTEEIAGVPFEIDTSFDQDTYSFLGGVDGRFGEDGPRIGFFAGYITSDVDFSSYSATGSYDGGTVGAYIDYTTGGFYVDAMVKADFLDLDYSAPVGGSGNADVTNIGVRGNIGYRMYSGQMFFEPIGSLAYVNTQVDDFDDDGASIAFNDGESFRAGIGGQVGTTVGGPSATQIELALLGKIWGEFGDDNVVTITDTGTGDSTSFEDEIDGAYGEVVGTATFYSADRMWSGFVSGGADFNDETLIIKAEAGLRRNF